MFHLLVGIVTWLSFPSSQSCECVVLLWYAVVGLRIVESRIRGWVCLRKLVFGATQTNLDYWLSSPQPLKSIGKGSQGLRDCEAKKGLVPGVGINPTVWAWLICVPWLCVSLL